MPLGHLRGDLGGHGFLDLFFDGWIFDRRIFEPRLFGRWIFDGWIFDGWIFGRRIFKRRIFESRLSGRWIFGRRIFESRFFRRRFFGRRLCNRFADHARPLHELLGQVELVFHVVRQLVGKSAARHHQERDNESKDPGSFHCHQKSLPFR